MENSKLDTLDFVINVLKEYDKSLNKLVERLYILINTFSIIQTRKEVMRYKIEKTA